MTQEEFLHQVGDCLEAAGIAYMVAGSHGSSSYGKPRATMDVDLVIDPTPEQLEQLLTMLAQNYYVSPEAARDALHQRSMFNIIEFASGWKADLIIRKDRPFSILEFQRRQVRSLQGRPTPVASAEDIILSKLEWAKLTPSERQLNDAYNVVVAQGPQLDQAYLRTWAAVLGVAEPLEELLKKAKELEPDQTIPKATSKESE
jgi:hypothetical protein